MERWEKTGLGEWGGHPSPPSKLTHSELGAGTWAFGKAGVGS